MARPSLRSRIYPVILIIAVFIVWKYREANTLHTVYLTGVTFGTVEYHITYRDIDSRNFQKQIDSLLVDFNQSLSTYIPDSEISLFNKGRSFEFGSPYFPEVLAASKEVYEASGGAFDPTIGPLIDAWGFGAEDAIDPDSSQVDSLLRYTGFDKISFDQSKVEKLVDGLRLSFSAIAKGQAIDVVGNYLADQGIEHYFVEIGGEVRCLGLNPDEVTWLVGIELPDETRVGVPFDALALDNAAMATSGNYRQFRTVNGRKVAHTINPKTGFPKMQTLLSATVVAPDCMHADAYATACMVLGLEASKELIASDPDLEAYFIYADEQGDMVAYISPGLEDKAGSLNATE